MKFFYIRLPFNWKTPLGFFAALTIQAFASYFTLLSTASILCFLVGLCLLLIGFVEDLTSNLNALSATEIPNKTHEKLTEDFHNAMRLYSQVKELSFEPSTAWHSNIHSRFYAIVL